MLTKFYVGKTKVSLTGMAAGVIRRPILHNFTRFVVRDIICKVKLMGLNSMYICSEDVNPGHRFFCLKTYNLKCETFTQLF